MRRLSLSSKLFAAALPLVLAVGALLALTVRSDLGTAADAERASKLGQTWDPLTAALTSIEAEFGGLSTMMSGAAAPAAADVEAMTVVRRATDDAITALSGEIDSLGAAEAARKHITQARSSLSAARRVIDISVTAPEMTSDIDPIVAFDIAMRELVSIGQLLPAESGEAELGRQLLAVVKLAEARVAADVVAANVAAWQIDPMDSGPLANAQVRFVEIESALSEFDAVAPDAWSQEFRRSGATTVLARHRTQLDSARRATDAGQTGSFDLAGFQEWSNQSLAVQRQITSEIVSEATADAKTVSRSALVRSGVTLAAVLTAVLITWLLTRSVTRRVRAVSRRANQVANEQLPALVEALRDPRGRAVLPGVAPVSAKGDDELAELAHAFNAVQETLVDVANEQVEVLRRGVSDIFVTMARRNRSLIDRQLAMLDEFEAEVDDSELLAKYYQLDHLATRMRRNSESLLVLANAEPKRRRVKATEIDDVVRAAIGEVEDYRRIEVESLESLQVRGNVVADISHLIAELLDNATAFSPPDSAVRVGGRRAGDSYVLRIVDNGVGIGAERLRELNEMLREPPMVGLSVEPTLGMSVVSLLAHRHGVAVHLSQGSPGTTVDILLPSSLFGPIDVPSASDAPSASEPAPLPAAVHGIDLASLRDAASDVGVGAVPVAAPAPAPSLSAGLTFETDPFSHSSHEITAPVATPVAPPAAAPAHVPAQLSAAAPVVDQPPALAVRETADFPTLTPPTSDELTAGPLPVAAVGEFDRPPAPPVLPDGLSRGPVAPSDAMPLSTMRLPEAPIEPALPTRTPGSGPDGPDRLAGVPATPGLGAAMVLPDAPVAPTSSPSALQAALSAFDARRHAGDSLPTRSRSLESFSLDLPEPPPSTVQSRLDPEALRERLRAFQSEFKSAGSTAEATTTTPSTPSFDAPIVDLGGDR